MRKETIYTHSAGDFPFGAIEPPIFLTSTFGNAEINGYSYTRTSNPTRKALEVTVAAAEGGKYGLAFASGLAAEETLFSCYDKIICDEFTYGGTRRLLKIGGKSVTFLNFDDFPTISDTIDEKTLLFCETPTNPLMKIRNIRELATICHEKGGKLAIDNTFMTPYLQNPLKLGADIVVHSATKYLCGHHDSIAGCIVTNDENLFEKLYYIRNTKGNALSPFDSYLVKRGMETLPIRMEKHCINARSVHKWLETSEIAENIRFPGGNEPENEIHRRQSTGNGAIITFALKNCDAIEKCKRLKLIKLAESLGGNISLITHPYSQTHNSLNEEEKKNSGIKVNTLRLSVGTENPIDIINDLKYAFGQNK